MTPAADCPCEWITARSTRQTTSAPRSSSGGITLSYAFVAEPQTNGVAERFNRTMKEQAIQGRLFKNVEEVRVAAIAFKDRYNREWRLEKLGFKSPLEARQAALLPLAA
ncbi:MAG: integrase core domain-containing protein [Burkholderia sp.]